MLQFLAAGVIRQGAGVDGGVHVRWGEILFVEITADRQQNRLVRTDVGIAAEMVGILDKADALVDKFGRIERIAFAVGACLVKAFVCLEDGLMFFERIQEIHAAIHDPAAHLRTGEFLALLGQELVQYRTDFGRVFGQFDVLRFALHAELCVDIQNHAAVRIQNLALQRAEHQMLAGVFKVGFAAGEFFVDLVHDGCGLGRTESTQVLHVVGTDDIMNRQVRHFDGAHGAFRTFDRLTGCAALFAGNQVDFAVLELNIGISGGQIFGFEDAQLADLACARVDFVDGGGHSLHAKFAVIG